MATIILNDFVILLILTILHVLALVYVVKVGSIFNSRSWNFIIAAFAVLLISRFIAFLDVFDIVSYTGSVVLLDSVYVPIVFLALIVIGMMRIFYKVKSSIDIERRIKSVTKKKRRKRL